MENLLFRGMMQGNLREDKNFKNHRTGVQKEQDRSVIKMRKHSSFVSTLTNVTWTLLLTLALQAVPVQCQIGVTICACQPSVYEFKLNFSLACSQKTVVGPGIVSSACTVDTELAQNVTDFTPVRVTTIQILELNQNLDVIAQTFLNGNYGSGDTFRYVSVTVSPNTTSALQIPKGIQISLAGTNQFDQALVNFWLILFTNDCGIYPVILQGQEIGWTIFAGLVPPPEILCPAAAGITASPIVQVVPTKSPSQLPVPGTTSPSQLPVPGTTMRPTTQHPTFVPSAPSTAAPSTCIPRPKNLYGGNYVAAKGSTKAHYYYSKSLLNGLSTPKSSGTKKGSSSNTPPKTTLRSPSWPTATSSGGYFVSKGTGGWSVTGPVKGGSTGSSKSGPPPSKGASGPPPSKGGSPSSPKGSPSSPKGSPSYPKGSPSPNGSNGENCGPAPSMFPFPVPSAIVYCPEEPSPAPTPAPVPPSVCPPFDMYPGFKMGSAGGGPSKGGTIKGSSKGSSGSSLPSSKSGPSPGMSPSKGSGSWSGVTGPSKGGMSSPAKGSSPGKWPSPSGSSNMNGTSSGIVWPWPPGCPIPPKPAPAPTPVCPPFEMYPGYTSKTGSGPSGSSKGGSPSGATMGSSKSSGGGLPSSKGGMISKSSGGPGMSGWYSSNSSASAMPGSKVSSPAGWSPSGPSKSSPSGGIVWPWPLGCPIPPMPAPVPSPPTSPVCPPFDLYPGYKTGNSPASGPSKGGPPGGTMGGGSLPSSKGASVGMSKSVASPAITPPGWPTTTSWNSGMVNSPSGYNASGGGSMTPGWPSGPSKSAGSTVSKSSGVSPSSKGALPGGSPWSTGPSSKGGAIWPWPPGCPIPPLPAPAPMPVCPPFVLYPGYSPVPVMSNATEIPCSKGGSPGTITGSSKSGGSSLPSSKGGFPAKPSKGGSTPASKGKTYWPPGCPIPPLPAPPGQPSKGAGSKATGKVSSKVAVNCSKLGWTTTKRKSSYYDGGMSKLTVGPAYRRLMIGSHTSYPSGRSTGQPSLRASQSFYPSASIYPSACPEPMAKGTTSSKVPPPAVGSAPKSGSKPGPSPKTSEVGTSPGGGGSSKMGPGWNPAPFGSMPPTSNSYSPTPIYPGMENPPYGGTWTSKSGMPPKSGSPPGPLTSGPPPPPKVSSPSGMPEGGVPAPYSSGMSVWPSPSPNSGNTMENPPAVPSTISISGSLWPTQSQSAPAPGRTPGNVFGP